VREWLNQMSAYLAVVSGVSGFFTPRFPASWLHPPGSIEATSAYDTGCLKATLEQLIDFDRINANRTRLSVGAVYVRSGNFVNFDSATHTIGPEHIMASAALPPGFAAVEIDGEQYWDGGLVSNTPLHWVVDSRPHLDTLIFQVDLWSARGELPGTLAEVSTRKKEIRYSSRTRAGTDSFKYVQRLSRAMTDLIEKLPDDLRNCFGGATAPAGKRSKVYNIAHLIYRARNYEGHSKDYDFSRTSMQEHWCAGYQDAVRTLRHPELFQRPSNDEGVFTFDLPSRRPRIEGAWPKSAVCALHSDMSGSIKCRSRRLAIEDYALIDDYAAGCRSTKSLPLDLQTEAKDAAVLLRA
jgi:NTE family protein